jgi:chromosome segregation ATPase
MRALSLLIAAVYAALLSRRDSTSLAASTSTGANLDKVIGVLKEMLAKFNTQMSDDKTNWENYQKMSAEEEASRKAFIQEQEGVTMSATAQLNANKQQVQTLTGQIADLGSEILSTKSGLAELQRLRQEEHKGHEEEVADLSKTIGAINNAVEVLEGHYASGLSMEEIKQQVNSALSTLALARSSDPKMTVVTKFLQDPQWLNTDGDSAYSSYKGVAAESGGVIGTLKAIRTTLMENKQGSIEKENESRRQYEVAKESKEADLRRSVEEKGTKENTKDECDAKIQHFTAVISQAGSDIKDAKLTIDTLVADLALFSKEFETRSAMRSSEMMATQAAYDALQEVTAGAKSSVEGVFLQRAVSSAVPCARCAAAVRRLQKVGARYQDASLVQVTTALESHLRGTEKDPQAYFDPEAMAPVKGLLKQLISKLEDELAAEKTHHEWCETEKTSAKEAKEEREKNIADLNQEIASLTTTIAQLGTEVDYCIAELTRVHQETETAARLRKEEAAAYVKAKSDHDEVIAALDKAITALSRQYGLVQVRTSSTRAQQKQSPFSSYQTGSGGSALEMLQDLQSRYSQARTQLVQGEEKAKVAYTDLIARNEQFRKDVTQTKLAKTTEKRQKTERLGNAKIELGANKKELAEVIQYRADLAPSCDDVRVTFEERKKRREAEIAALKETLAVLDDPISF